MSNNNSDVLPNDDFVENHTENIRFQDLTVREYDTIFDRYIFHLYLNTPDAKENPQCIANIEEHMARQTYTRIAETKAQYLAGGTIHLSKIYYLRFEYGDLIMDGEVKWIYPEPRNN